MISDFLTPPTKKAGNEKRKQVTSLESKSRSIRVFLYDKGVLRNQQFKSVVERDTIIRGIYQAHCLAYPVLYLDLRSAGERRAAECYHMTRLPCRFLFFV